MGDVSANEGAVATKPVSLGRRVFGAVVFVLLAALCVILGMVEGGMYPYGFAGLFLWLALFAIVPRGRNPFVDSVVELIGGLVLFVAGVLTILDREEVREMAAAGRDRSFLIIWIVAPILILGGFFYTLRNLARLARTRH